MKKIKKKIVVLLTLLCLLLPFEPALANTAYKTFTEDGYGQYVETQTAYTVRETIVKFDEELFLQAADMKIGKDGNIYIADTGNKRILVGKSDGTLVRTFGEGVLQKPTGIFLSHDDKVYVADEVATKVFVFSLEGELLQEFERPESILFGEKATFVPEKVAVDKRDNVYVISRGNSNGIIQINANNGEFIGYFAPNQTVVTPLTAFRKAIFTEEQLSKMIDSVPATAKNLNIDEKGLVYAVSQGERVEGIRKLNVAGKNILDAAVYDDFPVSVEIGSLENIFVAGENGFIYEYTSEGNLLFVFGGQDDGRQRVGLFSKISAIAVDQNNQIYALDPEKNQIQIFQPTEFANLVHQSLELYQNGDYDASKEPWQEVIRLNGLFDFAHLGLGEAYFKEENYNLSLDSFRQAKYKEGYSDAFWEVRNKWMRENVIYFIYILIAWFILAKILGWLNRKYEWKKQVRNRVNEKYEFKFIKNVLFIKNLIRHPIDSYYSIQHENKASYGSAIFWLGILFVLFVAEKYYSGFIFRYVREGEFSLGMDFVGFFFLFLLVIVSHYLICTINDGEGKFKHVFISFIYAFAPFFIFKPFLIILSNFLTFNEAYLLNLANFIIYVWVGILLFVMIKEINDYTIRDTIKIIFLTLFMILIAVLLLFIVYVLVLQMIQFVVSLVNEGVYRFENR
ncbi:YIP1 family protein [Gracilibacillus marinus]|uniref:YIP1 family protein n=1 Tax=Gracilibacillus marinus TaxID=630535 RepID=A0ABV8VQK1_9BACI